MPGKSRLPLSLVAIIGVSAAALLYSRSQINKGISNTITEQTPEPRVSDVKTGALAFSPDGSQLAGIFKDAGLTGKVEQTYPLALWELPSGKHLRTMRVSVESINRLEWSPDGKVLQNSGRWVQRFDPETGKEISAPLKLATTMVPASKIPFGPSFPDGPNHLVPVGGADLGIMKSFAPVSSEEGMYEMSFEFKSFDVLDRGTSTLIRPKRRDIPSETLLDVGPDGQTCLISEGNSMGSQDTTLSCFLPRQHKRLWKSTVPLNGYSSTLDARFSPTGSYIVLHMDGGSGSTLAILNSSDGKLVSKRTFTDNQTKWNFVPGQDRIVVACTGSAGSSSLKPAWAGSKQLQFVTLADGQTRDTLALPAKLMFLQSVAVNADGSRLAIGDSTGLRAWNIKDLQTASDEPPSLYFTLPKNQ